MIAAASHYPSLTYANPSSGEERNTREHENLEKKGEQQAEYITRASGTIRAREEKSENLEQESAREGDQVKLQRREEHEE